MASKTRESQARTSQTPASRSSRKISDSASQKSFATSPETTYKTQTSTGKRKRQTDESEEQQTTPTRSRQTKQQGSTSKKDEEKRPKPFRKHAPKTFLEKLERAQNQRMIVVGRRRLGSGSDLREELDIVGSTGNIYTVTIGRLPACTCPDHLKGNECKHKVYAMHTVLKAPEHLQYQRGLLTSEIEEIFAGAPPIPTTTGNDEDKDGKRKPVEGECPICYMDFEEGEDELVWCKAACGNNIHKSCFEKWAASQKGKAVRCVYCRTEWQMDEGDMEQIQKAGTVNEEGYLNVAEQFGISRARDYSSYYQPWARRQFGYGW